MGKVFVNFDVTFRLEKTESVRSYQQHWERLRRFAELLTEVGFPIENWFIPGDSEANSRIHAAFTSSDPTDAALEWSKNRSQNSDARSFVAVWNGIQGDGGAAFNTSYALNEPCLTHFQSRGVASLAHYATIANLLQRVLQIWPAQAIQVAPTKYESVFPDRLSVGWMVYLPHTLTAAQVPEARAVIPVMRDDKQQGTIIVSVTDEVFDVNNRDHLKVANDIEIRLADQDLLPRFVDL
jgi:hypothetical protein